MTNHYLSPVFIPLLLANAIVALAALAGLYLRGACSRLVSLRLYMIYILLGPGAVGLSYLLRWQHLSREDYLTASWIICLADNALLLLLALEFTSWMIPQLKMFVGLWSGSIATVVMLLHFAELPAHGSARVYWFMARCVNLSVLVVMLLLFPGKYVVPRDRWRRDYGWTALGIVTLASGNVLLNTVPVAWMLRWPMVYGVSVPMIALATNAMFACAAWQRYTNGKASREQITAATVS